MPLEELLVTSQEEQMIGSLVERVNSTQLTERDPDAADMLKRGFASNPDAVYVLAQTVLVQNIALEQARAQLADAQQQLQQQAQQPAKSGSFLGNLLGHRDPQPPPLPGGYQQVYNPQAQPEYQTPYYPNQPQYGQPQYGQPQYGQPQYVVAPPGQPSFLRSAAQTAAGVAAGALVFEGVESLLHGGFGHPGFGMGGFGGPGLGFGGGGYERPIEENIVNNYYDSPEPEHHHQESSGSWDSGSDSGGGWDSGSNDSGSWDNGGGNDDGGF
jgi:uncharacterized protein